MLSRARPGRGFTLLEVLVALAVLATGVLMISRLFSHDLRSLSYSADYTSAVAAAQDKMREVLAKNTLAAGSSRIGGNDSGGYDYEVSVYPVFEDKTGSLNCKLLEVDLAVHWQEGGRQKSLTLKTLKEVENKP
ncbi:MAG: prepilin-type N-terminal cleavage/methylation domain-containing protein [Actinomycetota bacterium]|nr:prepilin-type N-terminal cleavage/methylation domain-containing protein [Actinomycetota bacterium]